MNKCWHLLVFIICSCAHVQERFHVVRPGESVVSIAKRYSIPQPDLVRANGEILSGGSLRVGTKLFLPYEVTPGWDDEFAVPGERENRQPSGTFNGGRFLWPVSGSITSRFGRRHRDYHEGIDIAAPHGTVVKAARSGHVIYAGNRIKGYGNVVIVRHQEGFSTVYGHLSRIFVRRGQYLARGIRLGRVGQSGRATGPHLHFEVRDNRVPVNPLLYLNTLTSANILRR